MSQILSFTSALTYVGYILIAILVLLLMVLIHELGHYTAGKILKFKINEFSIGFGPKILQKTKKNGEKISLRAFPLGGYCAFEGEEEEADGKDKTKSEEIHSNSDIVFEGETAKPTPKYNPAAFNNQKPWKRLIVLFFGAFFNFLSAIIFSFILLLANGYDLVQVKNINENSINYGILQTTDVIVGIENQKIDFVHDLYISNLLSNTVSNKYPKYTGESLTAEKSYVEEGKTYYLVPEHINFNIKRGKEEISTQGNINVIFNDKGECVGWSMLSSNEATDEFQIGTYKYTFGETCREFIPFTFKWAWKVLDIFGKLITGQLSIKAIGGPVTTINMIASTTKAGFSNILVLLPLIAVNLAVFNLLPIPALDGFQMIFVLIEWIRKKPVKRSVINTINNVGLIVLLGFVIIVDLIQFVPWFG